MTINGKQLNYDEWMLPISIHPAPKKGWEVTNNLGNAKQLRVRASKLFIKCLSSSNLKTVEVQRGTGKIKTEEWGKRDIKLWTPCVWKELKGNRRMEKIDTIHAYVIDADAVSSDKKDEILTRLQGYTYNAHSTFSEGARHKPGHCFRVVIPLSRPATKNEWTTLWRNITDTICPENDEATKDPSRFWYLHSYRVDRKENIWNVCNSGVTIDVDKALALQQKKIEFDAPSRSNDNPQPHNEGGKYKSMNVNPERIKIQIVPQGTIYTFKQIIDDWSEITKSYGLARNGLNVLCPYNGTSRGSAFITRKMGMVSNYPVFTLTSNAMRTHYKSVNSSHGVILHYKTGLPIIDRGNCTRHLHANYPDLWMDTRTATAYRGDSKMEDWDIDGLGVKVTQELNPMAACIGNKVFFRSYMSAAAKNGRDPLLEKLNALPEWCPDTGEHRLEDFFIKYLKVEDTPINRIYSKKFFIGALARAYHWGCKLDAALILKGEQGIKKSSIWEALSMGCFVDEKIDINDKDGKAKLRQGWIIELAELSAVKGKQIEDIRHFITLKADLYREPFGYKNEYHLRRCVLVGSTNEDDFLLDPKGSRRFWVMESMAKEYEETCEIDEIIDIVPMLWAEAKYYLEQGTTFREDGTPKFAPYLYWLTQEEFELSKAKNEEYKPIDTHEDLVAKWLHARQGTKVCVLDVINGAYNPENTKLKPRSWTGHIPQILNALGCIKGRRIRINGSRTSQWEVPMWDELKKHTAQKNEEDKEGMEEYYRLKG